MSALPWLQPERVQALESALARRVLVLDDHDRLCGIVSLTVPWAR